MTRKQSEDPDAIDRDESATSSPASTESRGTPDGPESESPAEERRHPAVIATAIALPVALVVGVIVAAVLVNRSPVRDPVALGPVDAPSSATSECADLLTALPDALGDYDAAELADPAPAGARAWSNADDVEADPVVLRCGLVRPDAFDVASALQVINGVQWFEVDGTDSGIDASTWFVVDRPVYVALTVPSGSGPTPLQDTSDAIASVLPQQALDPAPLQ